MKILFLLVIFSIFAVWEEYKIAMRDRKIRLLEFTLKRDNEDSVIVNCLKCKWEQTIFLYKSINKNNDGHYN